MKKLNSGSIRPILYIDIWMANAKKVSFIEIKQQQKKGRGGWGGWGRGIVLLWWKKERMARGTLNALSLSKITSKIF